jgi:ATP-dependent Clp protease protease subunit
MQKNLVCSHTPQATEVKYIFVTSFNDAAVADFLKEMVIMQLDPKYQVIPVVISSYGGYLHALLAMIDLIQASPKPVATIAVGKAMSCGAVLLAAGTKGLRFAAPNTDIMIHEVSSGDHGKTSELQTSTKQTTKLNNFMFEFLTKCSNRKEKDYFKKMIKKNGNVDWHLTAEEFKRLGLIDQVCVPNLVTL